MAQTTSQSIFDTLGLQNLPEERKVELMVKMGSLVQRDVMIKALDRLSEAEKDELQKVVEKNPDDPAQAYAFIEKKVSDIDDIVKESIESLREELLALTQ